MTESRLQWLKRRKLLKPTRSACWHHQMFHPDIERRTQVYTKTSKLISKIWMMLKLNWKTIANTYWSIAPRMHTAQDRLLSKMVKCMPTLSQSPCQGVMPRVPLERSGVLTKSSIRRKEHNLWIDQMRRNGSKTMIWKILNLKLFQNKNLKMRKELIKMKRFFECNQNPYQILNWAARTARNQYLIYIRRREDTRKTKKWIRIMW